LSPSGQGRSRRRDARIRSRVERANWLAPRRRTHVVRSHEGRAGLRRRLLLPVWPVLGALLVVRSILAAVRVLRRRVHRRVSLLRRRLLPGRLLRRRLPGVRTRLLHPRDSVATLSPAARAMVASVTTASRLHLQSRSTASSLKVSV